MCKTLETYDKVRSLILEQQKELLDLVSNIQEEESLENDEIREIIGNTLRVIEAQNNALSFMMSDQKSFIRKRDKAVK